MPPARRVPGKSSNSNSRSQGSNSANSSAFGGEPGQGNDDGIANTSAAAPSEQVPQEPPLGAGFGALQAFLQDHELEEADLWFLEDNDLPDLILRVQLRRYRTTRVPPPIAMFGQPDDTGNAPEKVWHTPPSVMQQHSLLGTHFSSGTPAPTFAGHENGPPNAPNLAVAADPRSHSSDDVVPHGYRSSLGDHLNGSSSPSATGVGSLYRGLSALSKVPLPDGGKYRGQQDARPIVCLLSDISSTAADFHLNAADTYLYLTQCLDSSVYKQLGKHIRRIGLSTGDSLQKLQEADRFLRARYKMTNNNGKFVARIDALKMEKLETPTSFVDRLRALLDEGLDIGIQHTPYQEKQLFIKGLSPHYREQACSVWPNISNINELAELLTDWDIQRKKYSHSVLGNTLNTTEQAMVSSTAESLPGIAQAVHTDNNKMATVASSIRKGSCYRCNKPGHRAGVCRSQNVYQINKRCSKCGDFSHSIAECMRTLLTPCPRCRKPGHMAGVCIESLATGPALSATATTNAESAVEKPACTESALMATQVDAPFAYLNTADNFNSECGTVGEPLDVPIFPPLHRYCRILPSTDDNHRGVLCRAQIDNGAGACYIDSTLLDDLRQRGVPYVERPTKNTYRTVFGNNEAQHHDTAVLLRFRLCPESGSSDVDTSSQIIELPFLVARPCTPRLLFGRPALPLLESTTPRNRSLFDEVPNADGTTRLKANIPMLENASVMPRSESSRNRSTTDRYILADVCDRMVADGKLARISPEEEHKVMCINEPVLVDKQEGIRVRQYPIPQSDVNRYRLTIDLRSVNELQLRNGVWVAPRTVHSKNTAAPQRPYQFQDTAATLLRDFPPSSRGWFAKIDFSDAFSSIAIDSVLGDKLFGIRISVPGESHPRIYAGRCLIQGWRWSSLIFARAVRWVLNKLTIPPGCHICHVQDDVIIGSHSKELCLTLQRRVIDLFKHYGFIVREDKCGDGPTITFCGLKADSHTILPAPKHPIDEKAIDHCLKELDDVNHIKDLLSLLRRWAGIFQYCKQWLPPDGQQALSQLYSIISKASQTDASLDPLSSDARTPLRSLGHLYVRGLPSLYLFRPWAIATLLVTDANVDNWAGVAIHVIQVPIDFLQRANLSEFGSSFDDLTKLCRQENIVLERDGYKILCLPAVFDGGSFHSNSFPGSSLAMTRSSTFRERAAQILFANRNSGILAGLVYGVTDNVNTTREWQSAITDFCGAWHSLYSNYISNVEKILWLPRTSSTVALIDHLARECGSQVSKDSVTETKHVDLRIATPEDVGDDDSTSSDTDSEDHPQAWSNDVKAYLDLSTLRTVSSTDPEALNLCKKPGYFWSNGTPGLLLRRIRHDLGGRVVLQVFIPKEFREALVKEVHLESSHGKSPNVASRLSSFCWFPAMKRFAAQVIRRCDSCQLVDPDGQQLPPPGSRKVDAKSWFEVGIDLIGPVRASSGSDSSSITASLLTATCAYTSFTAVFPLAGSFKAQNICDGLSVIFNRFGYPVRLRCDRAQAHLSKYMTEYCRLHGLQIKYSASRAPWTLGWVETRHRVINSTLARMLEGSGRSWDDPVVIAMLENCINSYGLDYEGAENVSPYELMFGFTPCSALQARLRIEQLDSDFDDIETDDPTELTSMARNRALRLDRLQQRFISIWQDRRERAFETALNKSSKHRSDRPISIGDRVLALGRREHKWSRRFRGPFKVTRIIGKRIAVLVHESTNVVEEHHIKNLKLFREDDDIPDEGVLDVDDDSRMDGLVSDDPEDLIHDKTVPDDDSRVAQDGSNNFPPQPRPQRAAKERALQALRAHDWNGDDDDT